MTPEEFHTATLARLQGLTTITVYDGNVPDHPAADPATGHVYPYVVLWPVPGRVPAAARNLENDAGGALTWDARVTLAAGQPAWVLQALPLVRARLEGWRPTPWTSLWEVDSGGVSVMRDEDVTPHRWYVPLTFRASA